MSLSEQRKIKEHYQKHTYLFSASELLNLRGYFKSVRKDTEMSTMFVEEVLSFNSFTERLCISGETKERIKYFERELRGKRLIELASGKHTRNQLIPLLAAFSGVSQYIGVEPGLNPFWGNLFWKKTVSKKVSHILSMYEDIAVKIPPIAYAIADALSYLSMQPSESAIICSFGLIDLLSSFCIGPSTLTLSPSLKLKHLELLDKYAELLIAEIYRVTPNNCITFHNIQSCHPALFTRVRFELESHVGGAHIFRKKQGHI